jgi:thioredoxin-like negative regulator of GroEL
MLEKMAKRKSDKLYLALVDFDKVPELREQHGITAIPTTSVFYKGNVLDLVEGNSWSQIVPLVNAAAKIV